MNAYNDFLTLTGDVATAQSDAAGDIATAQNDVVAEEKVAGSTACIR